MRLPPSPIPSSTSSLSLYSAEGLKKGFSMEGDYTRCGSRTIHARIFSIPYPFWHSSNLPPTTPSHTLTTYSLYQLGVLLPQQTALSDTATIIVEPVLGEGGYVPAPPEFLQGLRQVCDKYGILLIVDEVQTGFGRTGSYFVIEESGVRPDIMVIAKGLGNGFPISGVVSRTELTDQLKPGSIGGTYAGNAVCCAAATAVADVMKEETFSKTYKLARSSCSQPSMH